MNSVTQKQPNLALEEFFLGRTLASGLFEDRFGNIRNQFSAEVLGQWDGTTLLLSEAFYNQDGSHEHRDWQIVKYGANHYVGKTDSVIGEARGETRGNIFRWQYRFKLKVGERIWPVRFDDWMLLQPDGTLLNRAIVYRWGIRIGTVFLSFYKPTESSTTQHSTADHEQQSGRDRAQ